MIRMVKSGFAACLLFAIGMSTQAQDSDGVKVAQALRKGGQLVPAESDTTVVAEAEEFTAAKEGGWLAKPWGTNYYAATFANSFLSRKAYLSAPEQCDKSEATIEVQVPKDGRYLALVRYEAAYRFETQFRLKVEQDGKARLDRLYGARDNLKIWAFREKLKKEHAWPWGAVENVVWEGHDAAVELKAGKAKLTLTADKQPTPAARRNVDLVLLTSAEADVKNRIDKENYLPLDGLLTQAGDVYLKLHNAKDGAALTLTVPHCTEHSPYWVHIRTWKPKPITAQPGQSTDWVEVGSLLDSLNDGQWTLTPAAKGAMRFDVEFGVRGADGKIESIRRFANQTGPLSLAYQADTRYSRRIRSTDEVITDLMDYLKKHPVPGKAPERTLIYGYTFDAPDAKRQALVAEFQKMFSLAASHADVIPNSKMPTGYIDVRSIPTDKLEAHCQKLKADGKAERVAVVSLGDEIGLPAPPATDHKGFHAWCQAQKLAPADVEPAAGASWDKVTFDPDAKKSAINPARYYYSRRYAQHHGIQAMKQRTDILRKYLPNAGIGANYSPHHHHAYLGEVAQWVTLFRAGGMTQPWGEDYIWQLPVGTQQMNFIDLDMFRAAIRGKPEAKIHYYVMPHWPGNTPASWRRQFYGDLGHGMKIVNLFEFRPVQAAYTENHVSLPEMFLEVRRSFHEMGQFEDIIQDGQVRPAQAALYFSETGDIWDDYHGPFAAAKRTLYIAIRHQQVPLDFVVEADTLDGTLKSYKLLYLTDAHVSRAASQAIADWVKAGGTLFATAGAGMFDELNQPNKIMRELLGVEQTALDTPADSEVRLEKQDLPFAKEMDTVLVKKTIALPVIGARSRFTAKGADIHGTFKDGSPALVTKDTGKGRAVYYGFLPGLAYFKPAIPMRPVDRGSTDDSMAHFIPTGFLEIAGKLIVGERNLPLSCSNPLVESNIVEAKQGVVIPLVNWSGGPIKGLTVTLNIDVPDKSVTLASGKPVKMSKEKGQRVFTLDLDVADALILR